MIIRRKSIITSVPRARERKKRNLTTEKHEESQKKRYWTQIYAENAEEKGKKAFGVNNRQKADTGYSILDVRQAFGRKTRRFNDTFRIQNNIFRAFINR